VLKIRQASLSDYPAISEFINRAYGDLAAYKGEARWRWQFVDNPFRVAGDLPIWIALDGTRVVGQIGVQSAELKVDERLQPAGWIVDVMVLENYRGQGIAHRLYKAVAAKVPLLVTLTMAPATRRIAERLGAITLPPVYQFSRWARLDKQKIARFMAARTRHRKTWNKGALLAEKLGAPSMAAALVNPMLAVRDLMMRPCPTGLAINEVERFDHSVDDFWTQISRGYAYGVPRSTRFLNWRFLNCPQMNYRLFEARLYGKLVGTLVLRRTEVVELPQGIIVDLVTERGDISVLESLIDFALDWFGSDVASVEFGTSVQEISEVARKRNFLKTRTHRPTLICADPSLRRQIADPRKTWFLSKADHDWDQIRLG